MNTPAQQITESLAGAASVTVTSLYGLGRGAAMPPEEFPLAQINETLDGRVCDLCRHLHGMILAKGTAEYNRWRWPSHINCRRIMVDIHRDETDEEGNPITPDFRPPSQEMIDRYGHFNVDPLRHRTLRIPARPEARDFIYVRGPENTRGRLVWQEGLSQAAKRRVLDEIKYLNSTEGGLKSWADEFGHPRVLVGSVDPDVDLTTAIGHYRVMQAFTDRFPQAVADDPFTLCITDRGTDEMAEWFPLKRRLTLHPSWYGNPGALERLSHRLRQLVADGYYPAWQGDVAGALTHEFGHVICDRLGDDAIKIWCAAVDTEPYGGHVRRHPFRAHEAAATGFSALVGTDRSGWSEATRSLFLLLRRHGLL